MRSELVIRVVASLLLLGAASLHAREIPVYREYTRSVQFYDDSGVVMTDHQQGPDQVRLESLRSTKAQEAYLGKPILLDLGFESGESVFSSRRPVAAVTVPRASGDSGRQKKKESGQNWLAGSLALPSLGQTPSNAAVSVISAGAPDSGWGWLADEVSGQPDDISALTEELLAEEELSLGLPPEEAWSADPNNPYSTRHMESSSDFREAEARGMAGTFLDDERTGAEVSDSNLDRTRDPAPEWGSSRTDASTMKDYSVPSGMADMSRTRAVISEWSVGARPDFSSVATVGVRDNRADVRGRPSSGLSSRSWDTGSRSDWAGSRLLEASSAGGASSVKAPSWKGGWNAHQPKNSSSMQFKQMSDPVVIPTVPNSSAGGADPRRSSGGYKPAWY